MDIDIIRDQKLGAGAGVRSSKVSMGVLPEQITLWVNIVLLEDKSVSVCVCVRATAHPGWSVGSENIRTGHQSAVSLPHILGPPAKHWRPGVGVSVCAGRPEVKGWMHALTLYSDTSLSHRFDFANSNINDEHLNKMNPHHVPDVVRHVSAPRCNPTSTLMATCMIATHRFVRMAVILHGQWLSKVLIKKSYDRSRRAKRRNWKLQEMSRERDGMDTDDEK